MPAKREYRRHLPHQIPEAMPIFLTWNLKGAIPRDVVDRFRRERIRLEREPKRPGETTHDRAIRNWKLAFVKADEFLDRTANGPLHLNEPRCAQIVEDAIVSESNSQYNLWAWCIMPNHVHVLLTPKVELSTITQRLKGSTAREINKLHHQLGRTFWQAESYDHWARDEDEMLRIIHYIENNPVTARLCKLAANWQFSSARYRNKWSLGTQFVRHASA